MKSFHVSLGILIFLMRQQTKSYAAGVQPPEQNTVLPY